MRKKLKRKKAIDNLEAFTRVQREFHERVFNKSLKLIMTSIFIWEMKRSERKKKEETITQESCGDRYHIYLQTL